MELLNFDIDKLAQPGRAHRIPVEDAETRLPAIVDFYRTLYTSKGYDSLYGANIEIFARWTAKHYANLIDKGFALFGDVGRGKTFGMKMLAKFRGIRFYTARDLVFMWEKYGRDEVKGTINGDCIPSHEPYWRDIIIDDIGAEPTLNEFGTKREIMSDVMEMRIEAFEQYGALTCMTFNLPLEPVSGKPEADCVSKRYDDRFLSRLHELCHVLTIEGTDRRRE